MKRVSLLLTALCAAGLPLTAAALDYGPDQRILAADASAPALPSARGEENPFAELTAPHHTRADDEDTSTPANTDTEAHPAAPAHSSRRSSAPTPGPGPAAPPHTHSVLSWQSLLPGSIQ